MTETAQAGASCRHNPSRHKGSVYQITMSGIAVKGCYLVNTLTGATWTLYKDSDTEEIFWGLVQGPE